MKLKKVLGLFRLYFEKRVYAAVILLPRRSGAFWGNTKKDIF
jgi:hypothetical protein